RPLPDATPFESPPSLRTTLDTRDGPIGGMGISEGVTLITGGGFHGKSTLLAALQWGHRDHVPGDGRERVVSDPDTVKVRAEDGRRVERVDVSAFLRELPGGRSTRPLCTDDASGSTSQAAALVEAVEAGARVLLMDEDTCATNLMVSDATMRALIGAHREPITPLVDRIRDIHAQWGVSTILVVGGVGDYLAVADRVLLMDAWRPTEVTERARALAG
ncbi:MAG TPA: ATPase, partial [Deltaproteobacteria bacterium]|nr:ATPase [Deltaproteobacteria bacterium]